MKPLLLYLAYQRLVADPAPPGLFDKSLGYNLSDVVHVASSYDRGRAIISLGNVVHRSGLLGVVEWCWSERYDENRSIQQTNAVFPALRERSDCSISSIGRVCRARACQIAEDDHGRR
jgi:hypothetical protein